MADVLAGEHFADEVRADEQRARLLGINGVPFFAIDERYGISGAQSSDLILSALEQAWSERGRTSGVLNRTTVAPHLTFLGEESPTCQRRWFRSESSG